MCPLCRQRWTTSTTLPACGLDGNGQDSAKPFRIGERWERTACIRHHLHRDGREQQTGDPGHEEDAALPQQPEDGQREPHRQPQRHVHADDTERDGGELREVVHLPGEHHRGHDRARSREQRGAERHEGDVGVGVRGDSTPAGNGFVRRKLAHSPRGRDHLVRVGTIPIFARLAGQLAELTPRY